MPIRIFFSFDYAEDLWRASVVRNRWIADPSLANGGFWERDFVAGLPSPRSIELFIDSQLERADVTVVLIGQETAKREHVLYAIRRSAELGRGLIGIRIDQCRNQFGNPSLPGRNPFELVTVERDGQRRSLDDSVPVYDWVEQDGFGNLSGWIEEAVAATHRQPKPPARRFTPA